MEEDGPVAIGHPLGYPHAHEQTTTKEFWDSMLNCLFPNVVLFGDQGRSGVWEERSVWSDSEPFDCGRDRRRPCDSDEWLEEQCKVRAFDEEVGMVESEARSLPFLYCPSNMGQRYRDTPHYEGTIKWMFVLTNLVLEILSGFFDQLSSPRRPRYALVAMLMSIVAVLICIVEFAYKRHRKGYEVVGTRKSRYCGLFHYGNFVDNFGMLCSVVQCVCSVIQFSFFCGHADNPIKLSIFPIFFALSVTFSQLKSTYCTCCKD